MTSILCPELSLTVYGEKPAKKPGKIVQPEVPEIAEDTDEEPGDVDDEMSAWSSYDLTNDLIPDWINDFDDGDQWIARDPMFIPIGNIPNQNMFPFTDLFGPHIFQAPISKYQFGTGRGIGDEDGDDDEFSEIPKTKKQAIVEAPTQKAIEDVVAEEAGAAGGNVGAAGDKVVAFGEKTETAGQKEVASGEKEEASGEKEVAAGDAATESTSAEPVDE